MIAFVEEDLHALDHWFSSLGVALMNVKKNKITINIVVFCHLVICYEQMTFNHGFGH